MFRRARVSSGTASRPLGRALALPSLRFRWERMIESANSITRSAEVVVADMALRSKGSDWSLRTLGPNVI